MTEISMALVGVGPMAERHVEAISAVDGLRVVSAASRSIAKARAFATKHGIAIPRTIEDVVARPDADAIWVVTPCHVTASLAVSLGGHGRPLFLEKPVGLSGAESRMARDGIGAATMVGLNRRFYEVIRRGRALIEQAGGLRAIEVHMPEDLTRVPEGHHAEATLDAWPFANSIHLIDLLRFFGGEVDAVSTSNVVRSRADRSYNATMRFAGGARGVFHAQWYAPGGWRVAVHAEALSIIYQPIETARILRGGKTVVTSEIVEPDQPAKPGLIAQATAFRDYVRTGQLPLGASDMSDYVASVDLVERLTAVVDSQ